MFHRMMSYGLEQGTQTPVTTTAEGMAPPPPPSQPQVAAGLTRELVSRHLPKHKRHGDLLVVQEQAWSEFKRQLPLQVADEDSENSSPLSVDEDELASLVCQTLVGAPASRLAVDCGTRNDNYRSPNMRLVLGDSGLVEHRDNRIVYQFDVTKCMFSFGNVHEKQRLATLDCRHETVVDLFAGIGYFALPLLVHANARHLYACEWNPDAVEALRRNLELNKVEPSRCTILEGDNRLNRPPNVAQRVLLGILPSCQDWLNTALECVDKRTGATLHCHELVQTASKPPPSLDQLEQLPEQEPACDTSASESSPQPPSHESQDETNPEEATTTTNNHDNGSATSNHNHQLLNHNHQPPPPTTTTTTTTQQQLALYQARARALIDSIADELQAQRLTASLLNIQPIKSYAPHISHVVFDIRVDPL